MDTLLTIAEVGIAMAGFSAIVVMLRRGETSNRWQKQDADRFHGMIVHAVLAALFSFLPALFTGFQVAEIEALQWSSGLLGVATAIQLVIAFQLEREKTPWTASGLAVASVVVVITQIANCVADFGARSLGFYVAGLFWHILQASVLFSMLIWIPASSIEQAGDR